MKMEVERIRSQSAQRQLAVMLAGSDVSSWAVIENVIKGNEKATEQLMDFLSVEKTSENKEIFSKVCDGEIVITLFNETSVKFEHRGAGLNTGN
jgi:ribosomal protein L17